jgi:hypothetical protein
MNGKGDSPRNCFSEDFRSNYDQIFRKAGFRKAKARKALQRWALDGSKDAVVHHVGSSPRPMATEVRLDSQRIRS